ncbi:TIGR02270 family protein [Falsiroseomonas sp. HW251]|uniref:TIGR02270 family protein n=1 Tax=Falsiroseomonas sp. HW251 TaxID=3390998 RepID=UPI003D31117C
MTTTLEPVTETLLDNVASLWVQRRAMVAAPHVRLADLVRLDERLEASLEAGLARGLPFARRVAQDQVDQPELAFAACWLAVVHGRPSYLGSIAADDPASAIAALAFAHPDPARRAIGALHVSGEAVLRAVAIAALGARRADPGEALDRALADPAVPVRASASRVAGQLGRVDLRPRVIAAMAEDDPECRFQAAWAAARLGASEPLGVLATIARAEGPRADAALAMLLRRLPLAEANAWLAEFARRLPARRRSLIRAAGVVGDPRYIPWLLDRMQAPEEARLAGEALCLITGLDLAYLDLDGDRPEGFQSGPNDDPEDENVALDEDGDLPWPDARKLPDWWGRHQGHFPAGTAFFLGRPKEHADWLGALSDAFQRQRLAAAIELALRRPSAALFEARARGRAQRQQLAGAAGRKG